MGESVVPLVPRAGPEGFTRVEHDVLAVLAVAHPEGLWEQDLRDILHMHAAPGEAAEKLVARGLAIRHSQEPGMWKATGAGLEQAERI